MQSTTFLVYLSTVKYENIEVYSKRTSGVYIEG
jgi:hypothetical protein